jgi:hypothetical protein
MPMTREILAVTALSVGLLAALAHAQPPARSDTCLQGFVWRDAFPNDHVCVTLDTRERAARDNSQAAARREPGGGPYGVDTCRQGYVWRDAGPNDRVCVTLETRAETAADNAQAAARRVSSPLGPARTTPLAPPRAEPTPPPAAPGPASPQASFWATLPGILTAIGGVVGAIAALVAALKARR